MTETDLFVARDGAIVNLDGKEEFIQAGRTIVRAGHPIMQGREDLFEPLVVHYDVEPVSKRGGRQGGSRQPPA